jgi:hypothetical protein
MTKAHHRLKEEHALVLRGKHLHEAFHVVLKEYGVSDYHRCSSRSRSPHLDLLPVIVFELQHAQVMLDGHNQTMSLHKLFILSACDIGAVAERYDCCPGRVVVLIAEGAAIERLPGLRKVCEGGQACQ